MTVAEATHPALTASASECRNPACFEWGAPLLTPATNCGTCGWQLARVTDGDVALRTPHGYWALVDAQEVLATGAELPMRAWAIRLRVRALGHCNDTLVALRCVCFDGTPTRRHAATDVDVNGACRYCAGTGTITVEAARAWDTKHASRGGQVAK